jgi:hypothetical protein
MSAENNKALVRRFLEFINFMRYRIWSRASPHGDRNQNRGEESVQDQSINDPEQHPREGFCMDAADRRFIDLTNLHLADSKCPGYPRAPA